MIKLLSLIFLFPAIFVPNTFAKETVKNNLITIETFNNIYPDEWAYKVLRKSIINRGCNTQLPKRQVEINNFSNIVSECLSKIDNKNNSEKLLFKAFNNGKTFKEKNLKSYKEFEAGSLSKTTLVDFEVNFVLGSNKYSGKTNSSSNDQTHPDRLNSDHGKTTFHYESTVDLTTFFSDQDFLRSSFNKFSD